MNTQSRWFQLFKLIFMFEIFFNCKHDFYYCPNVWSSHKIATDIHSCFLEGYYRKYTLINLQCKNEWITLGVMCLDGHWRCSVNHIHTKKVRALSWTFVHSMSFMLIGPGLVQDGHSQTKMKSPVNLGCYYRKSKSYLIYIFLNGR